MTDWDTTRIALAKIPLFSGLNFSPKPNKIGKRKKLLIGAGAVGTLGVGGYTAHKYKVGGKAIEKLVNKARGKIHSVAEKAGREAGITAGKATNSASASYTKTIGSGISNVSKKFRGGNFVWKILKKIILKGK